jgi:hypothetical protein
MYYYTHMCVAPLYVATSLNVAIAAKYCTIVAKCHARKILDREMSHVTLNHTHNLNILSYYSQVFFLKSYLLGPFVNLQIL